MLLHPARLRIEIGLFLACSTLIACSTPSEDPAATLSRAAQALREGRSAEARSLAREGAPRAALSPDPTLPVRYRLLEAEAHLFLLQPKEAAVLLNEPIPDEPPFGPSRKRRTYLQGYFEVLARQPTALDTLEKAASEALSDGQFDVALDATILRCQRLLQLGQFDLAERLLVDALGRANDQVAYQRGAILLNLGMSRLVRNRHDEALTYFEQVLADSSLEATLIYRIALTNAGMCYARLGELERAIAVQQRAVEGHERAGLNQYLQQALGELSGSYLLSGNVDNAVFGLQRALDIATTNNYSVDAVVWANNLAIAYGDAGNWERAEHFNDIAMQLRKDARASSLPYNIFNRARIAAGRGQTDAAIAAFAEAIEGASKDPYARWMAQAGLAQVYRQNGRMPEAIRHFEEALGIIERTRAELISREYRLTFLSRLIRFHQNYVDALMENGDVERALEVAESSRARVLAERQGVARTERVPASAFVKLAARTGSVLLSYWLAPTRSFAWIITSDGIRSVTLPPRDEIATLVRGYRDFVTTSLADPLASSSIPGHKLSDTLLKPVLDAVLIGNPTSPTRPTSPTSPTVVIVPDDALHGLSFDMLPVESPRPHYWIEDVIVTIAPSLALAAESQTARAHAEKSLLLVGDPTHVDHSLPPLTFAGSELSGIARAFGGKSDTLRGADATPRAVADRRPERYSLIHFAAHATASVDSPLDSAILLSPEQDLRTAEAVPSVPGGPSLGVPSVRGVSEPQAANPKPRDASLQASKPPGPEASGPTPQAANPVYKLYARDVIGLPLTADVVTLSACRSAGGRAYGGEGLVGFAWAFLRAGARQVVAGLWDVDDQSTALLMERFYARLGAGVPPAAALRDAKLSLLKGGGNFRKPYYWAAFAVFSSSLDPS